MSVASGRAWTQRGILVIVVLPALVVGLRLVLPIGKVSFQPLKGGREKREHVKQWIINTYLKLDGAGQASAFVR